MRVRGNQEHAGQRCSVEPFQRYMWYDPSCTMLNCFCGIVHYTGQRKGTVRFTLPLTFPKDLRNIDGGTIRYGLSLGCGIYKYITCGVWQESAGDCENKIASSSTPWERFLTCLFTELCCKNQALLHFAALEWIITWMSLKGLSFIWLIFLVVNKWLCSASYKGYHPFFSFVEWHIFRINMFWTCSIFQIKQSFLWLQAQTNPFKAYTTLSTSICYIITYIN